MDIPPVIKNNWPYIAGGVIGIVALIYISRSGGSSSGSSDMSAYLASQAAAGQANQQYALAKSAQDAQTALANKQLDVQAMQAQGAVISAVAGAAGGLVQSLNAPTVAALNAAAAENSVTIQGAVANSIAGYTAQGSMLQSVANASSSYASALAEQSKALSGAVQSAQNAIGNQARADSQYMASATQSQSQASAAKWGAVAGAVSSLGGAAIAASDERVKLNVNETERNSVEDIQALAFVQFDYDESKVGEQLIPHFDVGVIAQQAEKINPNWVVELDGIKQVVIPTMLMSALHAIQTLSLRVAELEGRNGAVH